MSTMTAMITNIKQQLMRKYILWIIPAIFLVACNETTEQGDTNDDAGHGHDHGSRMNLDTTIWAGGVELFVEYPAFVVGHTSRFAAHFTRLDGHQPVKEGSVTVSLIKGTKGIRHTVEVPSSPGIFTPALQPREEGEYQLIFELNAPGLKKRIDAGMVQVYPDDQAATKSLTGHDQPEPEISFLKEQAWKIDFQTVRAKRDTVYGVVKAAGKWMPTPGTQRTLNAATSGNVLYEIPGLVEGITVSKGQVLLRISGKDLNVSSIGSEIQKAKAEFEQARSEYERKQELHELEVVPKAELEEVKKRYKVAQANYQQLLKNYGASGVAISAPFDGYVKHISVDNGAFANAGQSLLTVGTDLTSMIKATAAPEKRDLIAQTKKVWIVENGKTIPVKGKVVSIGRNVTKDNPLLPVFIEIKTPVSAVEGSLGEVQLGYSTGETGLVIPKNALLEDFGTYKVIVQTGGEGFEMRTVKVGAFNGDRVAITEGMQENEWVVAEGAYQVKMASMSGTVPAHGHTH